jgi:site-specific DNA recombinase
MQEENYSLPTQEAACRERAAALDYRVIGVYKDVQSGAELWERPQLTVLRELVQAEVVNAIIAYDPDRLSRRQIHFAVLVDECERLNVALLFVNGEHDRTALGEFLSNVRAFVAEMEREKFRERSMRGIQARMKSGKLRPSNRPLFGYRWADDEKAAYVIDEEKATIVRRIFIMAAGGTPLRRIAETLTAEGVPTANGATFWYHNVVRAMLHHPAYKGMAVGNHTMAKRVGGKQKRTPKPADEHIHLPEGTIPAIVPTELWETVADRLTRNKAEATRNNQNAEAFLLRAGFVVCGYCGKPIRAVWTKDCPNQTARAYYSSDPGADRHHDCPAFAMSARKLDAAVWDGIKERIAREDVIAGEIERLREDDPTPADLTAVESTLAEISRKQDNLGRALALIDDPDAAAPLVAQLKVLAERKRELESERETIRTRRDNLQAVQSQLVNLQQWVRTVAENMDDLEYDDRRDLLRALDVRVKLFRKDHQPRWEITASLPIEAESNSDIVESRSTL